MEVIKFILVSSFSISRDFPNFGRRNGAWTFGLCLEGCYELEERHPRNPSVSYTWAIFFMRTCRI